MIMNLLYFNSMVLISLIPQFVNPIMFDKSGKWINTSVLVTILEIFQHITEIRVKLYVAYLAIVSYFSPSSLSPLCSHINTFKIIICSYFSLFKILSVILKYYYPISIMLSYSMPYTEFCQLGYFICVFMHSLIHLFNR